MYKQHMQYVCFCAQIYDYIGYILIYNLLCSEASLRYTAVYKINLLKKSLMELSSTTSISIILSHYQNQDTL